MNANSLSKQFELNLNKCIVLYYMMLTLLGARELGTECRYESLCNSVVVCGGG